MKKQTYSSYMLGEYRGCRIAMGIFLLAIALIYIVMAVLIGVSNGFGGSSDDVSGLVISVVIILILLAGGVGFLLWR